MRKYLTAGFVILIAIGGARVIAAAESGTLEGHLTITSLAGTQPSETSPSKDTADDYASYPLVVLSPDGKKVVRQLTADKNGDYRVALPPGDYVLDARGRAPKRVRATPKTFTVVSKQTVRVDFELDTGVR